VTRAGVKQAGRPRSRLAGMLIGCGVFLVFLAWRTLRRRHLLMLASHRVKGEVVELVPQHPHRRLTPFIPVVRFRGVDGAEVSRPVINGPVSGRKIAVGQQVFVAQERARPTSVWLLGWSQVFGLPNLWLAMGLFAIFVGLGLGPSPPLASCTARLGGAPAPDPARLAIVVFGSFALVTIFTVRRFQRGERELLRRYGPPAGAQ
jgi:hypothetical protein